MLELVDTIFEEEESVLEPWMTVLILETGRKEEEAKVDGD